MPLIYFSGKYLATVCALCRANHWALKKIQLTPHEYHSDVSLFCQLCGRDITTLKPHPLNAGPQEI